MVRRVGRVYAPDLAIHGPGYAANYLVNEAVDRSGWAYGDEHATKPHDALLRRLSELTNLYNGIAR